jgi:predicted nucleic acid-binding protein
MTQSKKVLLAPDILFAFIDRAHPKHEHASAYLRFFAQEEYTLFITLPSIITVYEQMYKDMSMSLAKDLIRTMSISDVNLIYPDDNDMKGTVKVLANTQTNEMTFPKALLLVCADRRKIPQLCTLEYINPLFGISLFALPI